MDRGEAPEHDRERAGEEPSGSVTVHRLEFSVDWPPWHAAAFLLEADDPVLVDAGVPGSTGEEEIREGLAASTAVPQTSPTYWSPTPTPTTSARSRRSGRPGRRSTPPG